MVNLMWNVKDIYGTIHNLSAGVGEEILAKRKKNI